MKTHYWDILSGGEYSSGVFPTGTAHEANIMGCIWLRKRIVRSHFIESTFPIGADYA